MRRTTNRRPIRLTETKLRSIIRNVIRENLSDLPGGRDHVTVSWSYLDTHNKSSIRKILQAISNQKEMQLFGSVDLASQAKSTSLEGSPYGRNERDANSYDNTLDPAVTYEISLRTKDRLSADAVEMTFSLNPVKYNEHVFRPHTIEVTIEAAPGFAHVISMECY